MFEEHPGDPADETQLRFGYMLETKYGLRRMAASRSGFDRSSPSPLRQPEHPGRHREDREVDLMTSSPAPDFPPVARPASRSRPRRRRQALERETGLLMGPMRKAES